LTYQIEIEPEAERQIRAFTAFYRGKIRSQIYRQLEHEPHVLSKHRKLRRNDSTYPWHLRIDDHRAMYTIESNVVRVLAIGVKIGNKLLIDGKEWKVDDEG